MNDWREIVGTPRGWARIAGVALVGGVFVGLIGPFGSFEIGPWRRIFYSVNVSLIGAVLLFPGMRLGVRLGRRAGLPLWLSSALTALVVSLPMWLLFNAIAPWLWLGRPPAPAAFWDGYFQVAIFMLPTGVAGGYLAGWWALTSAAPREPDPPGRLFVKLPAALGRDILALQAEDHYVRVHTAKGSALLLMRLADAIEDLGGLEGMRVHRSWWVSRHAISASAMQGRKLLLTLTNGVAAPVTRGTAPALRRAGWL